MGVGAGGRGGNNKKATKIHVRKKLEKNVRYQAWCILTLWSIVYRVPILLAHLCMYIFPYHIQESDEAQSDSSDEENCGKSSLDKRKKALLARFSRNAFRTSLSNRPEMFLWMEAQEKLEEKFKQVGCHYGCQQGSILKDMTKVWGDFWHDFR